MGTDILALTESLVADWADFFRQSMRMRRVVGKGKVEEVTVQTPFMLYDDRRISVRIRIDGNQLILHDNGSVIQYLQGYGIDLLKQKLPSKHQRWLGELMSRNGLSVDQRYKWFYKRIEKESKEDLLSFVESITAISFLVLPRSVGMQPLSWKDKLVYERLRGYIQSKVKDISITPGIRFSPINWSNQWGMMLRKKERSAIALQFLGGDNMQKIGENIMLTASVLSLQEKCMGVAPGNVIVVFSGHDDHFDWARSTFRFATSNLREGQEYPFVPVADKGSVVKLVKSRFSIRTSGAERTHHPSLVVDEEGKLRNLDVVNRVLEVSSDELLKAEVLEDDDCLSLMMELDAKARVFAYSEAGPILGDRSYLVLAKLASANFVDMYENSFGLSALGRSVVSNINRFMNEGQRP